MLEKFTNGEWQVVKNEINDVAHIVRMNTPNLNKYDARPYAALGGFPDENAKEEIEANAHLIAASKKLFYKLHEMEIFMEQMHEADPDWTIKESQLHHKEITALLAEARGE